MKKFSTKRKIGIILSWAAVAMCMGIIFHLSHQPSEESSELSMGVMNRFLEIFSLLTENIRHSTFRAIAHWLEYCGLGALLFHAFFQATYRAKPYLSFCIAAAYAITDEIHQIFIPGRAFQISDIAIDWLGAFVGVAVCMLIYSIAVKADHPSKRKLR